MYSSIIAQVVCLVLPELGVGHFESPTIDPDVSLAIVEREDKK